MYIPCTKEDFSMKQIHHTYSVEMKLALVKEYQEGDLSQVMFAKSKGINPCTFHSWISKVKEPDPQSAAGSQLVEITQPIVSAFNAKPATKAFVVIRINGTEIEVAKDSLKEFLEAISHD
jgi:transposase-like protein